MCIAILNNRNKLKKEYLNNCWENNPEGAGLLYNNKGKLTVFKSYNKKEFIKKYSKVREEINGKIVLHFRIATSGYEPYVNLHPFLVNESLGFVHNGIISGLGDNQYSDTFYLNETLKKFNHKFLECEATEELICGRINSSKLIFLDNQENHKIINEHLGVWDDGDWFSNESYKSNLNFYFFGNQKVAKQNHNQKDFLCFDEFDDLNHFDKFENIENHFDFESY